VRDERKCPRVAWPANLIQFAVVPSENSSSRRASFAANASQARFTGSRATCSDPPRSYALLMMRRRERKVQTYVSRTVQDHRTLDRDGSEEAES